MERLAPRRKPGSGWAVRELGRFGGTAFLATTALPVVPKPADAQVLTRSGRRFGASNFFSSSVAQIEGQACESLRARSCWPSRKHVAIVKPYLHHLFAVLGDEVGLGALGFVGAAEKGVTCRPNNRGPASKFFFWNLISQPNSTLEFATEKIGSNETSVNLGICGSRRRTRSAMATPSPVVQQMAAARRQSKAPRC